MEIKKKPTPEQVHEYRINREDENYEIYFDWIEKFDKEYDLTTVIFEESGKFGLKDAAGEVLIPAIYDAIGYTFHDNSRNRLTAAQLGDKVALVMPDGKGTPFTEFEYDDISLVGSETCPYEEFFLMTIGDKCGLSDTDGHFYIPVEADEVIEPCYNTIPYIKNGKYGFASISPRVTAEAIYDDYEWENDYLVVTKDGEKGYIDINGQFTTDPDKKHFDCINWQYLDSKLSVDYYYDQFYATVD